MAKKARKRCVRKGLRLCGDVLPGRSIEAPTTSNMSSPAASPDWYVYILRCSDDSLYCGVTNRPKKRLKVHNAGKGAKYTRGRLPVQIIYLERVGSRSAAQKREVQIKSLSRDEKLDMVRDKKDENRPHRLRFPTFEATSCSMLKRLLANRLKGRMDVSMLNKHDGTAWICSQCGDLSWDKTRRCQYCVVNHPETKRTKWFKVHVMTENFWRHLANGRKDKA